MHARLFVTGIQHCKLVDRKHANVMYLAPSPPANIHSLVNPLRRCKTHQKELVPTPNHQFQNVVVTLEKVFLNDIFTAKRTHFAFDALVESTFDDRNR